MPESPYNELAESAYLAKTRELIATHPLEPAELIEVVQGSWADIFASGFGAKGFKIGEDIFPKPQIMGFFLHELIPLELAARYPDVWRPEKDATDKDIVHIPDPEMSVEIKTSSHKTNIFGNRSYAQEAKSRGSRKSKDGYYLTVNFEKFAPKNPEPKVIRIRFGWLDHTDWVGQRAASGQQAHLTAAADQHKLIELFPKSQL